MRRLQVTVFVLTGIAVGLVSSTGRNDFRTPERAPASLQRAPAETKTPTPSVSPSHVPLKTTGIPHQSIWPNAGERWIFRFERKVSAEYQNRVWLSMKLGGRVSIEAAGTHGENRFYLLTSETDRMEMGNKTQAGRRSFPPVRLEIDTAGKLREIRWTAAGSPNEEDSDFIKDLVSQWFFFETTTRLGKAEVEWTENASGEMTSLTKKVIRYPSRPELSRLDSTHEWIARAKDGVLKVERIEGTENFVLRSTQGSFDQKTSYRWLWTTTETPGTLAKIDVVGEVVNVAEIARAPSKQVAPRFDPKLFAANWSKVGSLKPKERLKFFQTVKAALDGGQGELAALIAKSVEGKRAISVEWRTGIGALASSSNPEAAKALVTLYQESHRAPDEKLSILAGVTAGEGAPAPEWKEILEAEVAAAPAPVDAPKTDASKVAETAVVPTPKSPDPAEALREASLYALGSAIRKEEDTGRKKSLESLLWKEIKDSKSEAAQVTLLEAIGNSGSSEYYSFVKEQFASANPQVRAKAVGAVRFLASDLARTIIEPARGDPATIVRQAAEWSGKFQTSESD